ncbi:MAG: fatty acid desaturase [Alphaproteobacteria bacterium]|nr:fatty acid desaturase [Alphaproteobacteria bacterium]MBV9371460.1 fatty acid desaturase [Alphaproteobacteria bacterium]MBV9902397.1 fatty acid desaturase [Alphaproteobacteria bacterium]
MRERSQEGRFEALGVVPAALPDVPDVARFRLLLRKRVSAYVAAQPGGAKGDPRMWWKLASALAAYDAALALLLLHRGSAAGFLALYALFGAAQAYMLLNVGHDASHDAITRSPLANRLLRASLDMCGIDSRLFAVSHVELHHAFVNVGCKDEATRARGLLRLSPHQPRPRWGRAQHWLVWPVYALSSLDFIFVRDWEMLSHQPAALRHLVLGKALYLGATIGLPLWLTPHGLGVVLAGWFLSHLVVGLAVMLMLQISHLVDDSHFPAELSGSATDPRHVLATTMDVATESPLLGLAAGGLHQHVAHHFYPGMSHVHYRAVTRMIAQTARECGLPYRSHPRFVDAVSAHLRHLKKLGSPREEVLAGTARD